MKLYICHFPGCTYYTENRNKIDFHHIIPKELWPRINQNVTISFCPTHHRLIFHPDCKSGMHSIQSNDSLEILGIYKNTHGYSILYKKTDGTEFFEDFDDKEYQIKTV